MDTIIYFSLTVFYALLFVFGLISASKGHWSLYAFFLIIVIAALLYDNGIFALGRYIGEGELLKSLNVPRYWMHAFFTPLLIPFAWQTIKSAGVTWAKAPLPGYIVLGVTGSIILYDVIHLFNLSLQPVWQHGVLSYKRTSESGGPVMMIAVTFSILFAAIILWRKQGWKWLLVGIVLMAVVGALAIPFESKAIGNISELVLVLSLFATQLFSKP